MKLDINYIKWKIDKTEYFSYFETNGEWFISFDGCCVSFAGIEKDQVVNPLLLQKAVEGVNRKVELNSNDLFIDFGIRGISVKECNEYEKCFITYYFDKLQEDQAKESALKYIYEESS